MTVKKPGASSVLDMGGVHAHEGSRPVQASRGGGPRRGLAPDRCQTGANWKAACTCTCT